MYWHQKARKKWIIDSERNTRFFHASAIIKKNRQKICMLKDGNKEWCQDVDRLKEMVREFYTGLYTVESCIPSDSGSLNFPWLAYSDRRWLNHVIGDHEIEVAIFQMSEHKATGLNGVTAHFL